MQVSLYVLETHARMLMLAAGQQEYWDVFQDAYRAVMQHYRSGVWYDDADIVNGRSMHQQFQSLQAFWPGLLLLSSAMLCTTAGLLSLPVNCAVLCSSAMLVELSVEVYVIPRHAVLCCVMPRYASAC